MLKVPAGSHLCKKLQLMSGRQFPCVGAVLVDRAFVQV